ncbi:MAG: mechanosensitive ion channel domain-containing protein [Acidobacteriota bacterium]
MRGPLRGALWPLLAAAALLAASCREEAGAKPDALTAAFLPAGVTPAAPSALQATPPATIPVSDIPVEAERFEAKRRQIGANLTPGPELSDVGPQLSRLEQQTRRLLERPALSLAEEVQVVELQELDFELRETDAAAAKLETALEARSRALEADLDWLRAQGRRWAATLPAAQEHQAPEELQRRASEIAGAIDGLAAETKRRRDETLTQLDRVSRMRSSLDGARVETADRRKAAQRRLFAMAEAPLWKTAWAGRPIGRAALEQFSRDWRRLKRYLSENTGPALGRFVVSFFLALMLLFSLRRPAEEGAKEDPSARALLRATERPLAAATLIALLVLIWTTPGAVAPALYRDIAWVLLILSTAILLRKLLAEPVRRTILILAAAGCLYPLRYLFEQDPLLDRLVLILQVVAVGATLAADLRGGRWNSAFPGRRWQRFADAVLAMAILLLAGALVSAVLGYVGPARLLRSGTIASLGLGLASLGAYSLLYAIASALVSTRPARSLHLVKSRAKAIRRLLRRLLATLLLLEWALWTLAVFRFGTSALDLLQAFLKSSIRIGSAAVSVSGILTFLAVLAGTFLLAALVRFLLEGEIFPRLSLPRGLPFTISTIVRYAVLLSGVFLAFSAAGISLTRMTLLAGALGVGLGFGLQNLVSNFVSGIILLFERPIQVGDFIDVGSLVGQVRRIGMRSSTVLTADGAEVVVPNADLISKTVINWTLSDRRRRLEIKVGVAYGSDPEKVIGLLLEAASGHPEALSDPAPAAYFVGFGDSSLDFVLHVWVVHFERGLALQSAVRRAINRVLRDNGIEIPFPQRDVNIKSAVPATERPRAPGDKGPARDQ